MGPPCLKLDAAATIRAYASYPKRSSEFKTKFDHFKYYFSEIKAQVGTIRTFSNPPMTFLSACSLSSTGAGGGALCASASVMLAARLLYFHSGNSPPSCSSHNFSSSSSLRFRGCWRLSGCITAPLRIYSKFMDACQNLSQRAQEPFSALSPL